VDSVSQAPTATAGPPQASASAASAPPIAAPVGRLISSDSLPVGGFTPGMVLAGRYRVIGLIGRGGMGEVYRVDDLKLGQPVALKFLPKALADDSVKRERLFAEVRIARQVSHPNICRVYDISELDGRHFLTMEYIDGEDLASLLKRIGSLHGAKALDVARQLCAGLAAAHDKGVLHRDLKPANVMIDGRGHVRITDFGLAVAAGEEMPEADVSGTPPYMAPEQFAGKGASVRSDIYALGLVFYEVFTGKRAFEATTLAELRAKKETSTPTAPSEIARDIDPIVERVILRCIEKDPRQRPASAAQVSAALPGGDPLAAALAAGETPSPEMIAASGSKEGLRPWIAWACLAFIILGIGAVVMLKRQVSLWERVPMPNPPDVMAAKARDILKTIGYPNPPADSAFGYEPNNSYFQNVEKSNQSSNRYAALPALAVQFWYRQSPQPLQRLEPNTEVTLTVPLLINNGDSAVLLDSQGSLTGLHVIPPEAPKSSGTVQPPDWSALFASAGIDPVKLTPVEPDLSYLAYEDTRAAWTGTLPDRPDIPIRIEAAARGGKPVSWRLIAPKGESSTSSQSRSSTPIAGSIGVFIVVLLLIAGGAFFVRRNLRMGRGDRRGAFRLALFVFCLKAIEWIFGAHHVAAVGEPWLLLSAAGGWFFQSGFAWLTYIALEPFVRRRWPGVLVGWSRLLAGNYRDPLVGRDLLLGCGLGVLLALLRYFTYPLDSLFDAPQIRPSTGGFIAGSLEIFPVFSETHAIVPAIMEIIFIGIRFALTTGFILFLVRALFKRTWVAIAVLMAFTAMFIFGVSSLVSSILTLLAMSIIVFIYLRLGLLAAASSIIYSILLFFFPITTQMSAWYSGIGLTGLAVLLAIALYAFHTSLGGQPLFGRASLED
jgi:serine/threonine protein kinase